MFAEIRYLSKPFFFSCWALYEACCRSPTIAMCDLSELPQQCKHDSRAFPLIEMVHQLSSPSRGRFFPEKVPKHEHHLQMGGEWQAPPYHVIDRVRRVRVKFSKFA